MKVSKNLLRYCLPYDFKVALWTVTTCLRICQLFEDSNVNERTTRHWFQKSGRGDFSHCDEHHSGRPHALNDDSLQGAIEEDNSLTYVELANSITVLMKLLDLIFTS
ncbi:histone-lysine N-methyltransferase SETMAR [Nephila pilipes]|uniref:Histone-lysine N-methyltransferase SETMAR n=1 Tax=Nephila pilipes TaxID=299642 RepID=A0A8X6MLL1_NEPPI|nr:histone-lysine N-methyltransferase SETMAR [Nephila pilipes]